MTRSPKASRREKVRTQLKRLRGEARNAGCFAIGRARDCYGGITLHHIVAQQRLRRELEGNQLADALCDPRNLVGVCFGCHQLVEGCSIRVEVADLPEGFTDFIAQYGLEGALPRHLQAVIA